MLYSVLVYSLSSRERFPQASTSVLYIFNDILLHFSPFLKENNHFNKEAGDYGRREAGRRTGLFRAQFGHHLDEYLEITGYRRPSFKFAQQTALYGDAKIYVAYMNNVQMRFGQHLRRAVNVLLDVRHGKQRCDAY
ncbi:uncharacterized protein BYT42DRAFT_602633 [Radiomyces spectabilis]|uniref:uncharacterized protein n=1 Tax=Radiomyces spectabilis TaxID=64574 RepID=UPI00221F7998|nr:uncharacterized protein BYT42DRAFT_602633 [Radiomyces spectabilis]KAI8388007.1 hypothetical protein BYT42DRAFT_602633 [Radiomyces spectabilis]